MDSGDLVTIVTEMNADDRADLFNSLTPEEQQRLLPGLAHEEREDVCRLASHAEGTARAIMTSDFATLSAHMTTREAIDALRLEAPGKETIYRSYILDSDKRLIGAIRLHACFEETILAYVSLVFFMPVLIDSSGNAGSQSATLMVRALATGDVVLKDWRNLLVRELLIAMAKGVTMALLVFPVGLMRGGPEIALVVGMTMVIVVIVGSLTGMSLPFLLSRLRLDPATASAPLVTTLSDAVGALV